MAYVRTATREDLPAIRDIYNAAGVATTATYDLEPVDLENRVAWFERLTAAGCPVLVLAEEDRVVGYAAYAPFRPHGGYRHTVEHSVYLMPGCEGNGGGTLLMLELIRRAEAAGVHVMIGVLDAANQTSRRFHHKLGFVASAVLPQVGRKFDRWLDVVFMTRTFDGP